MIQKPILSAIDIHKSFKSGKIKTDVLKGLSLDLYGGEFTLLMGPSGAGKSTLLAAISALQKPDRGSVILNDIDMWGKRKISLSKLRLMYCGFIFQNVNLLDYLTANQQITFMLEQQTGMASKQARESAEASLAQVGLEGKGHLMPAELSGGEKQRVAIARTMAMNPQFIFADEPTSDLDSENGHMIVELLKTTAREKGAMVLCVTHDERVLDVADRIIHIEDGTITADSRKQKEAAQ